MRAIPLSYNGAHNPSMPIVCQTWPAKPRPYITSSSRYTSNPDVTFDEIDCVIVGAVGRPEFVRADWIKDGAVVVDAGYHPGGVGDIELGPLVDRVSAYTPVPGGVGPMTINTLIMQTVESGEKALG